MTNADPRRGDLDDTYKKELEAPGRIPPEWFDAQRVADCTVVGDAKFVNVMDARFLAEYDSNPRIRRAIERHLGNQYDLDAASMLLNLDRGRPITQAVSAVLWEEGYGGIRYLSRLDIEEECWAIFDHVQVEFGPRDRLDPSDEQHREAVTGVAAVLKLELPEAWT